MDSLPKIEVPPGECESKLRSKWLQETLRSASTKAGPQDAFTMSRSLGRHICVGSSTRGRT